MTEKAQTFLIAISITEGRHYVWPNMNSIVLVKIDNHKKYTSVKQNTDSPYYNEYFVFEFFCTVETLIDKIITITVIKPGSCVRKRKILGYVDLDVATVWYQPDHQFYEKWAILAAPPKKAVGGTRGYLKVNITILSKGESPKIPETSNTDEIEGNLLIPEGLVTERQRANFIIDVYRGEDFAKKVYINENKKLTEQNPSSYIKISFRGKKMKTSIQKNTSKPTWNERLILSGLFPPLCQRIRIELHHADSHKKEPKAVRYLNLPSVSNEREEGFLPTFGPTFLYFYSSNHLEGYVGQILISLESQILSNTSETENKPGSGDSPPSNENTLLRYEDVVLHGLIMDVSAVNKKYGDKPISFRMACGSLHNEVDDFADKPVPSVTPPIKPKQTNKNYCYLPLDSQKLYLTLSLSLPDFRKRIYNCNMLRRITSKMKSVMDEIDFTVNCNNDFRIDSEQIGKNLDEVIDYLIAASEKYIDIASTYNTSKDTNLEQKRIKCALREMEEINEISKSLLLFKSKRKKFQKLENLLERIEDLIRNIEDWPKVYLWMLYGHKRVAYCIIEPKDITFSVIDEEKGPRCGILQTIYFQTPNTPKSNTMDFIAMVAKVDIILWMGLQKHHEFYLQTIPEGFELSSEHPSNLIATQHYDFQCRAHIFQGRFTPGSDKSGLCDPFVHIIFGDQYRKSEVIKKTLSPIWDQTLVFRKIILYGSTYFIRNNPPTIFVEVYDKDECCRNELVGRCVIKPTIKMLEDDYVPPRFPPKLSWYTVYNKFDVSAEILAAIELLETVANSDEIEEDQRLVVTEIPADIKPNLVSYKIEVVFWGVRDLKKVEHCPINRPKIVVECANYVLSSDTLVHAKKGLNFTNYIKNLEIVFPEQAEYAPPLCLKLYDSRNFGINVFAGTHIVPVSKFLHEPMTADEREQKFLSLEINSLQKTLSSTIESVIAMVDDLNNNLEKKPAEEDLPQEMENQEKPNKKLCKKCFCRKKSETESKSRISNFCRSLFCRKVEKSNHSINEKTKILDTRDSVESQKKKCCMSCKRRSIFKKKDSLLFDDLEFVEEDDFDWWTKFYASLDDSEYEENSSCAYRIKLKIYPNELEAQPEFCAFTDMLKSFPMYKGKRTGDETVDRENTTAIFKGAMKIYRWPPVLMEGNLVTASGLPVDQGIFQDFPSNNPLRYVLRLYCVRALGLRPKDLNGKSDPYLYVNLNGRIANDKENRVMRQINPVFGRCFEFNAVFPQDHTLVVSIYDWDMATKDDLIGETKIDLENRFYSKHRAHCGLPETYDETGYCRWRDQQKPASILDGLCKKFCLSSPEYGATSVKVSSNEFQPESFEPSGNPDYDKQLLALATLRRWHQIPVVGCKLVPEHVETRSLFNPNKPGLEQGKLQLWIDIFPLTDFPTPKQVNIEPRKPVEYELRVIIWNTDNIKMDEDDFFTGERKSDIFVKGWLSGPENAQYTDIHYRSLSGEGNFNWRFVFPFAYLSTENKLVVRKKESMFAMDETEFKIPCRLTLQVWDNDSFSADDFLGIMKENSIPRPARSAKKCSLKILEKNVPIVNFFKVRRMRGWWPFKTIDNATTEEVYAGCVEVELEILPMEEAQKSPAGLGRDEPQALPKPNRPDTSFSWFRNPWKAIKYLFKLHKWKFIKALIILAVLALIGLAIYAFPGYGVKKFLGA